MGVLSFSEARDSSAGPRKATVQEQRAAHQEVRETLANIPSAEQTADQRANTARAIEQVDRQIAALDALIAAETEWMATVAEVLRLSKIADAAMAALTKAPSPTTLAALQEANAPWTAALDASDAAEARYLAARARFAS